MPVVDTWDFAPYSLEDRRLLFTVREQLTAACMSERGFRYVVQEPQYTENQPFVPLSLDRIPTDGYQQFPASNEPAFVPQPDESKPGFADALAAEDGSGCGEQAWAEIYGAPRNETDEQGRRVAAELTALDSFQALPDVDVTSRLLADPTFEQVNADWSRCMADAGHDYPDVDAAVTSFLTEDRSNGESPPSAAEVQVATADFNCRSSTGYYATIAAVRQRLVDEWLDANATVLAELNDRADNEMARVRELATKLGVL